MLLRVLYCSRTSLLLFYFARKGRWEGESERGIPFRSPSRFVNVTKMDTAILENKAAFSLCHDHQTFYIVCKKPQIVAKKATKCFMLTALTWQSSLTFLHLGVDKRCYVFGHARMLLTITNIVPWTFSLKSERSFRPRFQEESPWDEFAPWCIPWQITANPIRKRKFPYLWLAGGRCSPVVRMRKVGTVPWNWYFSTKRSK